MQTDMAWQCQYLDERNIPMAANKKRGGNQDDTERQEAGRKDSGAGSEQTGAVDGIGGVGGSSGTGGVRAKAREIGDVSGIDAELDPDEVPVPGSAGKGVARSRQLNDSGRPGKTRGDDSETIPNQESADQRDRGTIR
jgi:hypothetical protein